MKQLRRIRSLVLMALAIAFIALAVHAQAPATRPASSTVTGTWKWSYQGFGGNEVEVTLKLKQDGDKLTGTITGFQGEEMEIKDGAAKEGKITFKVVRDFGGTPSVTTYTGTISGDSFKGKSETVLTRDFDMKRAGQ